MKKQHIDTMDFADIDIGTAYLLGTEGISEPAYVLFGIGWNNGIKLEVLGFYNCYQVMLSKDTDVFNSLVLYNIEDIKKCIKSLIKQVQEGAFNHKKTQKDRVRKLVSEKGLASYMNNTKWKEFVYAMEHELPFPPPYVYKTLFEDGDMPYNRFITEANSPGSYDEESFEWWNFKIIEWVKIHPRYYVNRGGILVKKLELHDEEQEFTAVLDKYNIPYEENNGEYIIYGYR